MKTVGSILKERRMHKGYSLEDVERATKIRKKFLTAIESDDYSTLPSLSYAKGFVRNYSEFLGINSGNMMAFFRRQTKEVSRSSLLPKGMSEPLNRPLFQLTPSRFIVMTVSVLVLLFLGYFGLQYGRLQQPPTLVMDSPKANSVVADKRVDVLGRTDPDATVTVNGVSVIIRDDGQFFDQLTLEPGKNTITVIATSRFGKTTRIDRDVAFIP